MNFPPLVRSWLILIFIVLGTGVTAGYTAFLTGASVAGATLVGVGVASSNVVTNLMKSPSDRATDIQVKESNPPTT